MMSKCRIKSVFGRFSKEYTRQKGRISNPKEESYKKEKKYSTSPFLVVLVKVISQKPRYYKSPVSRVFTCLVGLYIPLLAQFVHGMDSAS